MNKKNIDQLIPKAYKQLSDVKIAEDGKINKAYRAQVSSFGAAISTGSLLAAVSFFSSQGSSSVPREKIIEGIKNLLEVEETTLLDYISANIKQELVIKERVLEAAIALKLAMNLYTFEEN